LKHEGHLIDGSMARRAADAFVDVNAVVEVDVIGQAVHLHPLNRLVGTVTLAHGFQIADVAEQHGMTIHAGLGWRNTRVRRRFHAGMTVAAINAVIANMMFVAELQRLVSRDAFVGNVRRPGDHQYSGESQVRENHQREHRKTRNQICTAVKNLGHVKICARGSLLSTGPSISEEATTPCAE